MRRDWAQRNYDSAAAARDYLLHKEEKLKRHAAYRATVQHAILHGARQAARRAAKGNATPSWADLDAIKTVYARAKELEAIDGVKRHVDHIIPLKGKNVSGLHVFCNLRIISATENLRKGTRVQAGVEECF